MAHVNAIDKVVREALARDFEHIRGAKIVDVLVRRAIGYDGDALLNISIIVDNPLKASDAGKLTGTGRHIRSGLEGIGEMAFPVLSFISKKDARGLKGAAA
jgi:hypothetical protein